MNVTASLELTRKTRALGAALAAACLLSSACSKSADSAATPEKPAASAAKDSAAPKHGEDSRAEKGQEGVTLTQEQRDAVGVTTHAAQVVEYREETPGYGVVLEHQSIAQALAEVQTAQAAARFSKASFERARQLRGTPGAISADLEQTAEQKSAVDSTALMLSTEKLSSTWGMQPPWKDDIRDPRVPALAHGTLQLVRVTFPLGSLAATVPNQLSAGRVGSTRPEATASLRPIWTAPADVNIPGRSFFTLLPGGTLAEGERLQVWAPVGQPTSGVLVPMSAVVLNAGKYWCYVEKKPGTFVRIELDTSRPTSGGYVVTTGVQPGEPIVDGAVSQLLAKEAGSSEEPD